MKFSTRVKLVVGLSALMVMSAALFIPCSEALASPLNGTWMFESGSFDGSSTGEGTGIIESTNPDRFPVRIEASGGGEYRVLVNNGDYVEYRGRMTSGPSQGYVWISTFVPAGGWIDGLTKTPGEEKYTIIVEGEVTTSELLGSSKAVMTKIEANGWITKFVFNLVGGGGSSGPITDPELIAFCEKGPRPGAASALTLRDSSNVDLVRSGAVSVKVYGFEQFNSMLGSDFNPGNITENVDRLRALMREGKAEGITKVYMTYFDIVGDVDRISESNSNYSLLRGEEFVYNNFLDTDDYFEEAAIFQLAPNRIGIMTFVPSSQTSNGGGGCSASGVGAMALMALAVPFVLKAKRRK